MYRATDTETSQTVALKESIGSAGRSASNREIKVLDSLAGKSNIIQKSDSFTYNRKVYIALEYARGGDLKRFDAVNALSDNIRKRIAKEIGHGLKQMHDAGWAHYDLHMSNVLVMAPWNEAKDYPADQPLVKLTDLGISKKLSTSKQKQLYMTKDLDRFRNILYELFLYKGKEFDIFLERSKTFSIDDFLKDAFLASI